MPLPTMNIAPLTINFTNTSVGDGCTYSWNFGDGSTSNQANPNHTFQAGAWQVTLTVTNANGSDQTSTTIVALPQSGGNNGDGNGKGGNGKGGNGKGGNGKGGNGKGGNGKGGTPNP